MKTKVILLMILSSISLGAFAESRLAPMAIEIRHTSIGTGIDVNLAKKIDQIIGRLLVRQELEYLKISGVGMEGESTQCLQFKDFGTAHQTFVEIEALVNSSRLTTVKKILDCNPNVVPKPNV